MNREENEIRRLFRELRREDERLAPPFARDWNAALSRTGGGRTRRRALRLRAATAAALVALGGLALATFNISSRRPTPHAAQGPVAAPARTQPPSVASVGALPSPVEEPEAWRNRGAKPDSKIGSARGLSKNIRRRTPPRPQAEVTLISRWRSPTEFLLNTPGGQLLRTVPRLDDSVLKIKTVTLDGND
jgi:hypothetical protein